MHLLEIYYLKQNSIFKTKQHAILDPRGPEKSNYTIIKTYIFNKMSSNTSKLQMKGLAAYLGQWLNAVVFGTYYVHKIEYTGRVERSSRTTDEVPSTHCQQNPLAL